METKVLSQLAKLQWFQMIYKEALKKLFTENPYNERF